MVSPLYQFGQAVYVRESAAVGLLEGYIISAIEFNGGGWIYKVSPDTIQQPQQSIITFGDRIGKTLPTTKLVFGESELVPLCTALGIVKAYLSNQVAITDTLIGANCLR